MAEELHLHRLLPGGPDDSEDDLEFTQHATNGGPRKRSEAARSVAKCLFLLFVMIVFALISFWAGTWVAMRRPTLDSTCAARTTRWCTCIYILTWTLNLTCF